MIDGEILLQKRMHSDDTVHCDLRRVLRRVVVLGTVAGGSGGWLVGSLEGANYRCPSHILPATHVMLHSPATGACLWSAGRGICKSSGGEWLRNWGRDRKCALRGLGTYDMAVECRILRERPQLAGRHGAKKGAIESGAPDAGGS